MKGKEAASAARRQAAQLDEEVSRLTAELTAERKARADETVTLQDEIRRLRTQMNARAADVAAAELSALREQLAEAAQTSTAAENATATAKQSKDILIRNACHYLSLMTGTAPAPALCQVATWATDRNFRGTETEAEIIQDLGVSPDGWVARTWRKHRRSVAAQVSGKNGECRPVAYSLPEALAAGFTPHAQYKAQWYEDPKPTRTPTGRITFKQL